MKKMKIGRNAFTLIELLAVIIILGILLLIAVPAVSKYIEDSRMKTYKSNLSRYIDAVRTEVISYSSNDFKFSNNEYLVVPLSCIELEKGNTSKSPFSDYNKDNSFVLVLRNNNEYKYYISALDSSGYGTKIVDAENVKVEKLSASDVGLLTASGVDLGLSKNDEYGLLNKSAKIYECDALKKEDLDDPTLVSAILKDNEEKSDSVITDFTLPPEGKMYETDSTGKLLTTIVKEEGTENDKIFKNSDSGLYYTNINTQDNKITYYFRGNVENNFVKFGQDIAGNDLYWRIVRINENGSIRMMYYGKKEGGTINISAIATLKYCKKGTGEGGIACEDVKLKYNSSNVEAAIFIWYDEKTNLNDFATYLDSEAKFCNDISDKFDDRAASPKFSCAEDYVIDGTVSEDGDEIIPIGLLSGDEAIYAGAPRNSKYASSNTFLSFTASSIMTMTNHGSPNSYYSCISNGILRIRQYSGSGTRIYPVINLKSTVNIASGNGTKDNPYVIKTN